MLTGSGNSRLKGGITVDVCDWWVDFVYELLSMFDVQEDPIVVCQLNSERGRP